MSTKYAQLMNVTKGSGRPDKHSAWRYSDAMLCVARRPVSYEQRRAGTTKNTRRLSVKDGVTCATAVACVATSMGVTRLPVDRCPSRAAAQARR